MELRKKLRVAGCAENATCNPQPLQPNVLAFYHKLLDVSTKTPWCFRKSPSRLTQMLHDRLHFRYQEGAALGVIIQVLQFRHQRRTTDDPTVKCLLCGFGTTARQVEQSEFGFAIRTESKHFFEC